MSKRSEQQMDLLKSILESPHRSPHEHPSPSGSDQVVFVIGDTEMTYTELKELSVSRAHNSTAKDRRNLRSKPTPAKQPIEPRGKTESDSTTTSEESGHRHRRRKHDHKRCHRSHHPHESVEKHTNDKLEQKYNELQALLNNRFLQKENKLLKEELRHSQQLMKTYLSHSNGSVPPVTWAERNLRTGPASRKKTEQLIGKDAGTRVENSTVASIIDVARANQSWETVSPRTNDTDNNELNSSLSSSKKVTFTEAEGKTEDVSPEIGVSIDSNIKGILKRDHNQSKKHSKTVVAKQGHRRFVAAHPITGKLGVIEGGIADFDSPQSPRRPITPTDCHLKNTDNNGIYEWLKSKRRLARKTKQERMSKLRSEREILQEQQQFKTERLIECDKAVDEWMAEKERQIRLLKKREREGKKRLRSEGNRPAGQGNLKSTTEPTTESNQTNQTLGKDSTDNEEHKEQPKMGDAEKVNAESVQSEKVKREMKLQAKLAAKIKAQGHGNRETSGRRPMSAKPRVTNKQNLATRPQSARKSEKSASQKREEEQDKVRLSYDKWLTEKKKQISDDKRIAKEKEEKERLSKSDPDLEKIIPDLARKRIDSINERKKRVDTGIKEIDSEVNSNSFGGEDHEKDASEAVIEDTPIKTTPHQPMFTWKLPPKDLDKMAYPKAPSPIRGQSSRRPQSAKPSFRHPTPPRPSKSPIPNRISQKTPASGYMPFATPLPPEISRLSDNEKSKAAAFRRKQYGKQIWENVAGERPEPQGCDQSENKIVSPKTNVSPNLSFSTGSTAAERAESTSPGNLSSSSVEEDIVSVSDISDGKVKNPTFLTSIE